MKRRSFLQIVGLATVTPKVVAEISPSLEPIDKSFYKRFRENVLEGFENKPQPLVQLTAGYDDFGDFYWVKSRMGDMYNQHEFKPVWVTHRIDALCDLLQNDYRRTYHTEVPVEQIEEVISALTQ